MRFKTRQTPEERAAAKLAKRDKKADDRLKQTRRKYEWHMVFAWKPVHLWEPFTDPHGMERMRRTRTMAWLERVARRKSNSDGNWQYASPPIILL